MKDFEIKKTFIKPKFFVATCLDAIQSSRYNGDPSSACNVDWFSCDFNR